MKQVDNDKVKQTIQAIDVIGSKMKQVDNDKVKQTIQAIDVIGLNYDCKPKDKIDAIDLKIIRLLSRDCRGSYKDISSTVGITPNAIKERINTMVCNGIIQSFIVNVNPALLGYEKECILILKHFKRTTPTNTISDQIIKQLSLIGEDFMLN